MQSRQPIRQTSRLERSGVTLIEILVVMTIIAILAAASLAMLARTGEAARATQTVTAIRQIDSLLKARYDELTKTFNDQETKRLRESTWINIPYNAETHPNLAGLPAAVRVAVTKSDRYRGMLPQRARDLWGIDDIPGNADDAPLLTIWLTATTVWNNVPINASTRANHTPETESSELLYLALTRGASSGAGQAILDSIHPRHIADTDGDGFPEFVDSWGKPLRFYNAPTRLIRPGGLGTVPTASQHALAASLIAGLPALPTGTAATPGFFAQTFNLDPLDPKGALRNPTLDATFFTPFEDRYRTPNTWFKPLIVSCGPDENLGLAEPAPPTTSTNPLYYRLGYTATSDDIDAATDNLTNLQAVQ